MLKEMRTLIGIDSAITSFEVDIAGVHFQYENGMFFYNKPAEKIVVNGTVVLDVPKRVRGAKQSPLTEFTSDVVSESVINGKKSK